MADCWDCGDKFSAGLWFDGKQVIAKQGRHQPGSFAVDIADTHPHPIRIEYTFNVPLFGAGVTLEWRAPAQLLRDEAVEAAKQSDIVIAFVGISPNLEGEEMPVHIEGFAGGDRTNLDLPKTQQDLLEAVAATGKPVVVVLMSGSAIAMNWANDHAAALLEAWYPGEAGGEAIADVLTGKANPSGRLPITFYASDGQLPPFTDYSMKNRTYRYFPGDPLYRFGYGLSYTTFRYSDLKLSTESLQAGEPLTADVRVHLAPHASAVVHFRLDARELSEVDDSGNRAVRAGDYRVFVGGTSPAADGSSSGVSAKLSITGSKDLPE
jgi:beta-glucosidase